jgi:hypothetical protein
VLLPQVPPESPLAAVTALPHTVTGAFTGTTVPLPEMGPLSLPLSPEPLFPPLPPGPEPPFGLLPQVPLESPPSAVTLLPHTVTGAFTGTVVPFPEPRPLSLPLLSEPLLAEVALGPDPPALVPFQHEPPELPLSTVAELPHTVMGAFTATDVPFPEIGPLLLPLSEAAEPLELEACVPPLPTDTG